MNPDFLPYYQFKNSIDHKGYKIVVYENNTHKNLKKYVISVVKGNKKIGEVESNVDAQTVTKIKDRIDLALERGARLDYLKWTE